MLNMYIIIRNIVGTKIYDIYEEGRYKKIKIFRKFIIKMYQKFPDRSCFYNPVLHIDSTVKGIPK